MSEYWKSTPRYWCKHCACYVRDTKIERGNHEATAKHQGALKRSLRNLHREHEREERDKARAQREVARLNGVVCGGATAAAAAAAGGGGGGGNDSAAASEWQRRTQREQLAALGVAVPGDLRQEMAMPGEWTVTSTRVLEEGEQKKAEDTAGRSAGGKRGAGEDEERREEEEEAVRGLFKRPRRWGRDSKTMPGGEEEEDGDLEALLSGTMALKRSGGEAKEEEEEDGLPRVKKEEEEGKEGLLAVKEEPETGAVLDEVPRVKAEEGEGPAVVFKKRKPKTMRSK